MSIPYKMRPAGLESLPLGYTRLDFLEATGTQVINTGLIPTTKTGFKCKTQATTNEQIDRYYCGCQTAIYGLWLAARVQSDYKLCIQNGSLNSGIITIADAQSPMSAVEAACNFYNSGTAGRLDDQLNINMQGTWSAQFALFKATYRSDGRYDPTAPFRIFYFALTEVDKLVRDFIPVLDTIGRPCMFDTVSKQPFYNQGTGEFIAGLTMGQARNLAYLPAPTTINALTISLPKDATIAQYNQEVNAAIAAADAKGWSIDVQYRDEFEDAVLRNKYKYAECTNMDDVLAVNPDYKNDLTEDGAWIYPLPEMVRADSFMANNKKLEIFEQDLPSLTVGDAWFHRSGLKRFKGDISKVSSSSFMFAGTNLKYPEDFDADMAWLSWANGMFGELEMSKELTLKIIDLLPVKTNPNVAKITLGISREFEYDAELLAAIDLIDYTKTPVADGGKGWQVVIQWNGTASAASASTYGLRNRRDPIYAKITTLERPDGTTENFLDWGHYVTNWEENDYQEFTSVEEAYEHFNLEMPAAEEPDAVAS